MAQPLGGLSDFTIPASTVFAPCLSLQAFCLSMEGRKCCLIHRRANTLKAVAQVITGIGHQLNQPRSRGSGFVPTTLNLPTKHCESTGKTSTTPMALPTQTCTPASLRKKLT